MWTAGTLHRTLLVAPQAWTTTVKFEFCTGSLQRKSAVYSRTSAGLNLQAAGGNSSARLSSSMGSCRGGDGEGGREEGTHAPEDE